MDHFFAGAFVRRRIQFMAKSQLFGGGPATGSSATAACSRCAAATRTRRRSRAPSRSSSAAARSACTARAAARAPASWRTRRSPGSGGWRSSPARRSCRSRSSAPIRSATGSGCSSRRVTVELRRAVPVRACARADARAAAGGGRQHPGAHPRDAHDELEPSWPSWRPAGRSTRPAVVGNTHQKVEFLVACAPQVLLQGFALGVYDVNAAGPEPLGASGLRT